MQNQWLQGAAATRKAFRPQFEQLDSRIVPAGLLVGQGQGTFVADAVQSGAGTAYHLTGDADLHGLGHVSVSGSLHGVGFIQQGHAGGTLTFANAKGSLTVEVTGPTQNAFAPLPELFHERIVAGTGAYKNWTGHESMQLDLWPAAESASSFPHGRFTLIENTSKVESPLHGIGAGKLTPEFGTPDLGMIVDLHGAADLAGLGHVTVNGSIHGVGNIAQGHATGTITFTNAHGSVTVALEGPEQAGFSALPKHFHYQVVESSGQYEGLVTEGTLYLNVAGPAGHQAFSLAI